MVIIKKDLCMDCLTLYQNGVERLLAHHIADAEFESALLLATVLDVSRSAVLLNLPAITPLQIEQFQGFIERRCNHEPFAYITGVQEFWSLDFKVTPDVLIPRPETELIIEHVSDLFPADSFTGQVLDCGTGSGILPITLASIFPKAVFTAIDISKQALAVAQENSKHHGVMEQIDFRQADFMCPFDFTTLFDLIVSNPPYVDPACFSGLQDDVVSFEPHLALDGKGDGFDIVEHLLRTLPKYLQSGGHLFMEIGFDQQQRAEDVLRSLSFYGQYKVHQDYAGLPRLIHAVRL